MNKLVFDLHRVICRDKKKFAISERSVFDVCTVRLDFNDLIKVVIISYGEILFHFALNKGMIYVQIYLLKQEDRIINPYMQGIFLQWGTNLQTC